MSLYSMGEEELRAHCKQILESLEFWLRRIIHDTLLKEFGEKYIEAIRKNGDPLLNGRIRKKIAERIEAEPERYSRQIDASLLDHLVDIICHPDNYKNYFISAFEQAFPDGNAEARTFMSRLVDPRNRLYHGNSISVRTAEQIICYSHDIIESLKNHYVETGK